MSDKIKGITIELDGDVTKLNKALKKTDKSIKNTNKELRQVNNLLKFNPKNTELLAQKQKLLSKNISDTSKKLNTMKQAQAEVNRLYKAGEIGEETMRKYKRELIATEGRLKNFKDQLKEVNKLAGDNIGKKLGDSLQTVGKGLENIGGKIKDTSDKLKKFSDGYNNYITKPAIAAGTAAGKLAMDLEDTVAKISTLSDESVMSNKEMEKSVLQLSDKYGLATTEIGNSIYDALSASVDTADVIDVIDKAVKTSEGSFSDLSDVIDGATTSMNAYGDEAFDMDRIMEIFVNTQNRGKIGVGELAKELGTIIPSAKNANLNIDTLATGYAILTKNGMQGSKATTVMKSAIDELSKSGSKSDEALRELTGKGFADLINDGKTAAEVLKILDDYARGSGKTLKDMFGSSEAGSGALALLADGVDGFNNQLKEMQTITGQVDAQYEKTNTTSRELKQAFNELKNAISEMGAYVLPIISELAKKVSGVAKAFNGLDDESKESIMNLMGLAIQFGLIMGVIVKVIGWIGTLVVFFGKLIGIIGGVIGVLSGLNPIFWAIIGVIGIVIGILKHFGLIFKDTGDKADGFKNKIKDTFNSVKETVTNGVNAVKDLLKNIFDVDFKLPTLPKIKLEGKLSLNPPSVPKIKWNAMGGIFTKPTIFNTANAGLQGVGEAGAEAIIPLKKLPDIMRKTYGNELGAAGGSYSVDVNVSGDGSQYLSIPRIAREVEKNIGKSIRHDSRRLGTKPRKIQL